ncbi:Na+/H+ antiporter subunit E [Microbacterium indicum]|uniref:Na+/H+ antiporter subunit E n=1 Tax=Microbacterium indicum TaxID=358100 RepID=UPI000423A7B9|nr:Na+/H+ antiporter subunit E [Microbacterium indicum]
MSPISWKRQAWIQLPFFVWLVVLWMLLWGQFTWLAFLTGVGIAAFVMAVFRLPPAELSGRVNLWWGLVFLCQFLAHLVLGSLQVAWYAVTPGARKVAIVRVPLRVDDDLIMSHTAVAMSLMPGSTVIEADRENRILYLHAIGAETMDDVERLRESVAVWERRIVRAVGSRAQLADLRRGCLPVMDREGGAS